MERRIIVGLAELYLANNPKNRVELIAEAAKDVEQWRKKGFFGKRMMRSASLSSAAQSAKV